MSQGRDPRAPVRVLQPTWNQAEQPMGCASRSGSRFTFETGAQNEVDRAESGSSGWTFSRFGAGTKPAFAVAGDGAVHAAFINEAVDGWVRYAHGVPGALEIIDAMDITDFQMGHDGARDLATLALAADDSAVITAQTHRSTRVVRVTNGTATDVATFTAPDGTFFGQPTKGGIDA